jgi:hypothetical protein
VIVVGATVCFDDGREGELTIGACTNEQKVQKGIFGHSVKEAPAWKRRFLGEGERKVYKHAQGGIGTVKEGGWLLGYQSRAMWVGISHGA